METNESQKRIAAGRRFKQHRDARRTAEGERLTQRDVAVLVGLARNKTKEALNTAQKIVSRYETGEIIKEADRKPLNDLLSKWEEDAEKFGVPAATTIGVQSGRNGSSRSGIANVEAEKFLDDVRDQLQQLLNNLDNTILSTSQRVERVQNFACTWYVAVKLAPMIEQQD